MSEKGKGALKTNWGDFIKSLSVGEVKKERKTPQKGVEANA